MADVRLSDEQEIGLISGNELLEIVVPGVANYKTTLFDFRDWLLANLTTSQTVQIKASDFSATNNYVYLINAASNPITATLPATPAEGTPVIFIDLGNTLSANSLTVTSAAGHTIDGVANYVVSGNGSALVLRYTSAQTKWVVENFHTNNLPNSRLAAMPPNTVKGNIAGASEKPADLTMEQLTIILPTFGGATATVDGLQGLVPAPLMGEEQFFLKADGSWASATVADGTYGSIVVSDSGAVWTLDANSVVNAQLDLMPQYSVKGNLTDQIATPQDLDMTELTSILNVYLGDSGGGGTKGLVPAAPPNTGSTHIFYADGTWNNPFVGIRGIVSFDDDGATWSLIDDSVTNVMLAEMPAYTIKGNNTNDFLAPIDLEPDEVVAFLPAFIGDASVGGVKGLVPAPAAGDGALRKVLCADGTWIEGGTGSGLDAIFSNASTVNGEVDTIHILSGTDVFNLPDADDFDKVVVVDYLGDFEANPLTINGFGTHTIGPNEDSSIILDRDASTVQLIFYQGRWSFYGTESFDDLSGGSSGNGADSYTLTDIKTANYSAASGDLIPCDTTGGTFTITLPSSGRVKIFDAVGVSEDTGFGDIPLTVAASTGTIMGDTDVLFDLGSKGHELYYVNGDWRIVDL